MKEELLDQSKLYIIGVSGGCDSMYLLDQLRLKQYHLVVCHVNYHYRDDSNEDTKLVQEYCLTYNIPLYIKECYSDDYHSGNFQEKARIIRYDFYLEVAKKYHTDLVLLAHHKDDYLENVLMQLEKHQTYFYLGIKEKNEINHLMIYRPLLDTYKQDIIQACKVNHIPYRDDYTNFETHFKRDQIRNTVLNKYTLEEKEALYSKAVSHNLRMAQLKKEIKPYLDEYYKKTIIDYTKIEIVHLKVFIYLIVHNAIKDEVTSSLIEEILKEMHSDKPNITIHLPVNKLFIKEYNNIYICEDRPIEDYAYTLEKLDLLNTPYFNISFEGLINSGVDVREDEFPLTIRNIRPGDTIKTSGGTKKVTRLFINNKIPTYQRKIYPIVVNRYNEIILIPDIAKNYTHLSTNANLFVII